MRTIWPARGESPDIEAQQKTQQALPDPDRTLLVQLLDAIPVNYADPHVSCDRGRKRCTIAGGQGTQATTSCCRPERTEKRGIALRSCLMKEANRTAIPAMVASSTEEQLVKLATGTVCSVRRRGVASSIRQMEAAEGTGGTMTMITTDESRSRAF